MSMETENDYVIRRLGIKGFPVDMFFHTYRVRFTKEKDLISEKPIK